MILQGILTLMVGVVKLEVGIKEKMVLDMPCEN